MNPPAIASVLAAASSTRIQYMATAAPTSAPPAPSAAPARGGDTRFSRHKTKIVALLAIVLLALGGHWVYMRYTHVYIDDARIDGEVITMASRVGGWLMDLPVIEGDEVKKGQLLARIDDRDSVLQREVLVAKLQTIESQIGVTRAQTGQVAQETAGRYQSETNRLAAAQADAAAAAAQLKQAEIEMKRMQGLAKYVTGQEIDQARAAHQLAQERQRKAVADVDAARGALSTAGGSRQQVQVIGQQQVVLARQADEIRAEIKRRDIDIADRTLIAPADGRVVMTFVRRGEHVAAGQRILMFHDPREIWVEANVKETDVRYLKPGMKADIKVDAYPGQIFKGEIFRIGQAATNRFALLPDPNPSGNFTKITQRLPLRVKLLDNDPRLRPGMMVEVIIETGKH
ncbi:MAG: HlyD family secretion protein [Betaproteobacteria bacterium]|nr:HlyD family secretion protein [Betaproteobacteria bacterium]